MPRALAGVVLISAAVACSGAAEAQSLPLIASDPPNASSVLAALQKSFPVARFCRNRPLQIARQKGDEWARVTFFDKETCSDKADNPPYIVILQRTDAGNWSIKCKEQRGDLPPYEYYSKHCGGMPREIYRFFFGIED
jgi:hypothetical protein